MVSAHHALQLITQSNNLNRGLVQAELLDHIFSSLLDLEANINQTALIQAIILQTMQKVLI